MNERPEDKAFLNAYLRLASEGKCDSPGGAEYKRVLAEWQMSGRPSTVETFIVSRANAALWDGRGREQMN